MHFAPNPFARIALHGAALLAWCSQLLAAPPGVRLVQTGNSFHMKTVPALAEVIEAAGITGHMLAAEVAPLAKLRQQIAWDAVTAHPLTGVTAAPARQ